MRASSSTSSSTLGHCDPSDCAPIKQVVYWGRIEGLLSDQTDLQEALNGLGVSDHNHDTVYALLGHSHAFADLALKPTTLSGYGITDAAAIDHNHDGVYSLVGHNHDASYSLLSHTHAFADLTAKPTTLGGYGITDSLPWVDDIVGWGAGHGGFRKPSFFVQENALFGFAGFLSASSANESGQLYFSNKTETRYAAMYLHPTNGSFNLESSDPWRFNLTPNVAGNNLLTTLTGAPILLTIETVAAAAYTFAAADNHKHKRFTNAGATAATVPLNATVAIPVGSRIRCTAAGAGTVTLTPEAGVTLNSRDGALASAGQFAVFEIEKVATDEWDCLGDLA